MQPVQPARRSQSAGGGGSFPALAAQAPALRTLAEASLRAVLRRWSYRQIQSFLHQDQALRRSLFVALHPVAGFAESLIISKHRLKTVVVPVGSPRMERDVTKALQIKFPNQKRQPTLEKKREIKEGEMAAATSILVELFQIPLLQSPEYGMRKIFALPRLPTTLRALILESGPSALSDFIPLNFFANLQGLWIPALSLSACLPTFTICGPEFIFLSGHASPDMVAKAVRRLRHCYLRGLLVSLDDVDDAIPSKVETAMAERNQKLSKVLDIRHPFTRRPVRLLLFTGQNYSHADTAKIFPTGDPFRRVHVLANCTRPTTRHHRRPPLPLH